MTTDRDPQVAALLEVIDADPPRPGFWEELEQRLRDDPSPALELASVPTADGARHLTAVRRRRIVAGVAAAAAVVAIALGGLALRDDHDAIKTVPAEPGPTSGVTDPGGSTVPGESQVTYGSDAPQGQVVGYVDEWIRSVVEGDTTHGWDLLGPQSQESLGSQAVYAESIGAYRETWGSYANLDARDTAIGRIGSTDDWLLVLAHRAGDPQPLTVVVHLFPAGNPGGAVEPFLPGPALNLIQMSGLPGAEGAVGPGDQVPLALDAGADTVVIIDGDPMPDASLVHGVNGAVTGVRLPADIADGTHRIGVAQRLPDGTLAADVRSFNVASPTG